MQTKDRLENPAFGCDRCTAIPRWFRPFPLRHLRRLLHESHESYSLSRCHHCGQVFLEHTKDIEWGKGKEDFWHRWAPLTSEEHATIDSRVALQTDDCAIIDSLNEFIVGRLRLVRDPYWSYYWTDAEHDLCDLFQAGW